MFSTIYLVESYWRSLGCMLHALELLMAEVESVHNKLALACFLSLTVSGGMAVIIPIDNYLVISAS